MAQLRPAQWATKKDLDDFKSGLEAVFEEVFARLDELGTQEQQIGVIAVGMVNLNTAVLELQNVMFGEDEPEAGPEPEEEDAPRYVGLEALVQGENAERMWRERDTSGDTDDVLMGYGSAEDAESAEAAALAELLRREAGAPEPEEAEETPEQEADRLRREASQEAHDRAVREASEQQTIFPPDPYGL